MRIPALFFFLTVLSVASPAQAGQPIFSEMPRWSGGWGVQAVQEFRHQRKVFSDGDTRLSTSHILNIDGVYTWKRWIRLTAKVPLVLNATREGQARERGLGSVTVALPLKQYFNLDGRSGSWTFTPQIRAPSMSQIVRGNPWQHGWGFGYETETYRYEIGPVLYWRFTDLWHFQTKWQYRRHKEPGTLNEHRVRLGLAMVF